MEPERGASIPLICPAAHIDYLVTACVTYGVVAENRACGLWDKMVYKMLDSSYRSIDPDSDLMSSLQDAASELCKMQYVRTELFVLPAMVHKALVEYTRSVRNAMDYNDSYVRAIVDALNEAIWKREVVDTKSDFYRSLPDLIYETPAMVVSPGSTHMNHYAQRVHIQGEGQ